ncbi:hypothetical protein BHE74_00002792 [Ensete ventricosum]|nr:hypothetical protein GW17_00000372 [Ensete ventricosum]RWW88333.1 hypothetical protein BHE74_00002792 [Ensete ventricosum]
MRRSTRKDLHRLQDRHRFPFPIRELQSEFAIEGEGILASEGRRTSNEDFVGGGARERPRDLNRSDATLIFLLLEPDGDLALQDSGLKRWTALDAHEALY